jgi:hypothetical protein
MFRYESTAASMTAASASPSDSHPDTADGASEEVTEVCAVSRGQDVGSGCDGGGEDRCVLVRQALFPRPDDKLGWRLSSPLD